MTPFSVPTRDEVNPNNQAIFDNLKNTLGFVHNITQIPIDFPVAPELEAVTA